MTFKKTKDTTRVTKKLLSWKEKTRVVTFNKKDEKLNNKIDFYEDWYERQGSGVSALVDGPPVEFDFDALRALVRKGKFSEVKEALSVVKSVLAKNEKFIDSEEYALEA
jgi:hypothetical protein